MSKYEAIISQRVNFSHNGSCTTIQNINQEPTRESTDSRPRGQFHTSTRPSEGSVNFVIFPGRLPAQPNTASQNQCQSPTETSSNNPSRHVAPTPGWVIAAFHPDTHCKVGRTLLTLCEGKGEDIFSTKFTFFNNFVFLGKRVLGTSAWHCVHLIRICKLHTKKLKKSNSFLSCYRVISLYVSS